MDHVDQALDDDHWQIEKVDDDGGIPTSVDFDAEELEEALLSANNAELIDLPIVQLAVDFRWLAVGFWFFWFQLRVWFCHD